MSTQQAVLTATEQKAVITLAEAAINGARQASGTISAMIEKKVVRKHYEYGKAPRIVLGVKGARKRCDESLKVLERVFYPLLDAENRATMAVLVDERFLSREVREERAKMRARGETPPPVPKRWADSDEKDEAEEEVGA